MVGFCGSDEKAEWLKSIGFDQVINYKTTKNIKVALAEAAPRGVDCYFDNVRLCWILKQAVHVNVLGWRRDQYYHTSAYEFVR